MTPESYHPQARTPDARGVDLSVGGHEEVRPYLGIFFRCANRYVRTFRSVDGSGYVARCPSCGNPVRFRVGPGGTSQRFFEVSCR